MITEHLFIAALIAALCSCDALSLGQFMISRPIFCSPLFGYLAGDIGIGLWIGIIAETIWINNIPLGAYVPLDISAIGILPVFWTIKYYPDISHSAVFGILLAIPFAYFAKEIDIFGRKINTKIMHWTERGLYEYKENRISKAIFLGIFLSILKFFLFYLIAFVLGGLLFNIYYSFLPDFAVNGLKKAWYFLPVIGFGSVIYSFINVKLPFLRK
jgi:mannose/fructose/N-acetylgalactosamine-specific phosphotransferase system component IIC